MSGAFDISELVGHAGYRPGRLQNLADLLAPRLAYVDILGMEPQPVAGVKPQLLEVG